MKKTEKKAMKLFIIVMLSLSLTAGYAQALPDLYNFGLQRQSTPSIYDPTGFLDLYTIISKFHWDVSKPDSSLPSMIWRDEAIDIAKGLWPGIVLTRPINAQLWGNVWKIDIKGCLDCSNCPEGYYCVGTPAGGIVKIDAKTGEIISVSGYK